MDDIITRIWHDLGGRIGGPLPLRLVLQPTMAAFLAIRAGLADARTNQPPYFWAIVHEASHRRQLIQEGWKAIARIFTMALVIDTIYQMIVFRWLYPTEALIVAFSLACVPYLLLRGPVGRLGRRLQPKKEAV
jgi:hypothetical protein